MVITVPRIAYCVLGNGGVVSLNNTKCLFMGVIAFFWLDFGAGNIVKYLCKSLFFELGGASKGFKPTGIDTKDTARVLIVPVICQCVSGLIGCTGYVTVLLNPQ